MLKAFHIAGLLALPFVCSFSQFTLAQEEAIAEAKPAAKSENQPEADAEPGRKLRPLTISVQLTTGDTKIVGTLVDSTQILLKTAFGEATIPLSEVAGVRLAAGEDTSTSIVMLNGDSITGATDLKYLTVETEWGTAKINGSSIQHMLFVPGLQWQQVAGIGGKRWNLTEGRPEVPQSASLPNPQSTIRSQSVPGTLSVPQVFQNSSGFQR